MLCPCLNSLLRAYCLIQNLDISCTAIQQWLCLEEAYFVHVHCSLLRQCACAMHTSRWCAIIYLNVLITLYLWNKLNFSLKQSNTRKRVVLSRAWTFIFCIPGKHLNHLDHLHYMLCPCLNSLLRPHCLIQDLDISCIAIQQWLCLEEAYFAHAHCSLLRQCACAMHTSRWCTIIYLNDLITSYLWNKLNFSLKQSNTRKRVIIHDMIFYEGTTLKHVCQHVENYGKPSSLHPTCCHQNQKYELTFNMFCQEPGQK